MGGKNTTTTVQKADPWGPAQPYLESIMSSAGDLYGSGGFAPDPFRGQRVAGQSGATQGAYEAIANRGAASPMINGATAALRPIMGGNVPYAGMMQTDPRLADMTSSGGVYRGLDAVRNNALGSAIPAAMAAFTGNGMTDSSTAMDTVGRAATEAIAPIDYGAWSDAQGRRLQAIGLDDQTRLQAAGMRQQGQLSAAGMMPEMQRASYLPAMMMSQAGGQQDAYRQRLIDARMGRYYEGQNRDRENLAGFAGMLGPIAGMGGTSSGSQSGGQSGVGQVAGAGLAGLGTYGALAGAGLGGPIGIAGGTLAALMGLI